MVSTVRADVLRDVPGTADDPIIAFTIFPEVVDAPLLPGIAVRGVDPDETKVLFDGFELPLLFHRDRGLRSTIVPHAFSDIALETGDVEFGRGTSFLRLTPRTTAGALQARATLTDFTLATPTPRDLLPLPGYGAARVGYLRQDLREGATTIDETFALRWKSGRWIYSVSGVASLDDHGFWARFVARSRYARGRWRASAAISPAIGYTAIDSRTSVMYSAPLAGLHRLEWSAGTDTTSAERGSDSEWFHDVAAWSSVAAWLSPQIIARAGVRVDAFERSHDVATQPRGSLEWRNTTTTAKLEAGAYRRAPELLPDVPLVQLNPERTTKIIATLLKGHDFDNMAGGARLRAYYIDRTHLIARDSFGTWGNTGLGTAKGVEISLYWFRDRWMGYVAGSLSTSALREYPRGRERPADYDQPLRVDSLFGYRTKRWTVMTRFSLSSGLPYTPVVGASFDSDGDHYVPAFAFTNSARLPWMHGLDVRADVLLGRGFSGFAELRNAYAARTALGYEYSYDFTERIAVALPILPFVGITYTMSAPAPRRPTQPIVARRGGER